jgi:hypothetical protein
MPLICKDQEGKSYLAWRFSPDEWESLRQENRQRRHLRMPCCQAQVVLRKSKLNTPHFAHARIGACTTAPMTKEHLCAQYEIAVAADEAGWIVQTEYRGDGWQADVYAEKGRARVVFEVQWSSQTLEETLARHQRYLDSVLRCMWFMRRPVSVTSRDMPVLELAFQSDKPMVRLEGSFSWMPLRNFINKVLDKRFRFAPLLGMTVPLELYAYASKPCKKCGTPIKRLENMVLCNSKAITGYPDQEIQLHDLEVKRWLLDLFTDALPERKTQQLGIGVVRWREPLRKFINDGLYPIPRSLKQCCAKCGWYLGGTDEDEDFFNFENGSELIAMIDITYPEQMNEVNNLQKWWILE